MGTDTVAVGVNGPLLDGAEDTVYVLPGVRIVVMIVSVPLMSVAFVPKGFVSGSPTNTPCAGHCTDLVYASRRVLPRK